MKEPDYVMPASGWYADPNQPTQLRYWDGRSWTEHIRAQQVGELPAFAGFEWGRPTGLRWLVLLPMSFGIVLGQVTLPLPSLLLVIASLVLGVAWDRPATGRRETASARGWGHPWWVRWVFVGLFAGVYATPWIVYPLTGEQGFGGGFFVAFSIGWLFVWFVIAPLALAWRPAQEEGAGRPTTGDTRL